MIRGHDQVLRAAGRKPRHLFDAWPQVARRFRAAERWLLLLDFDGTLAPITRDPQSAYLLRDAREVLRRLAGCRRVRIYVISGRRNAYLRRRVNVPGVRFMGLHGWDRPGVRLPTPERRRLLQAKHWLQPWLHLAPGIHLEDKRLSLTVHYRGAKVHEVKLVHEVVRWILHCLQPGVYLLDGKKIWEFLPSIVAGKGPATARLLTRFSRGWLPVYAGDDESDEPAFAALRRGVTIRVGGKGETQARFRLRGPHEVTEFLKRLEDMAR